MEIVGNELSVRVYAIFHLSRPIYVGQCNSSIKARIYKHWNNAFASYGRNKDLCPKLYEYFRTKPNKEEYKIEVLVLCSKNDACEWERHYIEKFDTKANGCNITAGGKNVRGEEHYLYGVKGGCPAATKASVAARIGKALSAEHRAKISARNKGVIRKGTLGIRDLDTGKEYPTLEIASKAFGVSSVLLRQYCKGKVKKPRFNLEFTRKEE
jgi:hypothetical protein